MKEYEVSFITKKGGIRNHIWYVRATNIKEARKEFEREYYERDKHTAHAFGVSVRFSWQP